MARRPGQERTCIGATISSQRASAPRRLHVIVCGRDGRRFPTAAASRARNSFANGYGTCRSLHEPWRRRRLLVSIYCRRPGALICHVVRLSGHATLQAIRYGRNARPTRASTAPGLRDLCVREQGAIFVFSSRARTCCLPWLPADIAHPRARTSGDRGNQVPAVRPPDAGRGYRGAGSGSR